MQMENVGVNGIILSALTTLMFKIEIVIKLENCAYKKCKLCIQ